MRNAFEKAGKTIAAMQELQKKHRFNFGISSTIFSKNLEDADNILAWAKKEKLDIVFNMVRFTDAMLGNAQLEAGMKPIGAEEQRMRKFFLDRVRQDPLLDGQNYIYMHYADMIANGYHRTAPCPFMTQGIMLNPNGDLFFCENSEVVGNVMQEDPEAIYFREASQAHRRSIRDAEVPDLPQPVPDERGGDQAGGAVRAVPGARVDGKTATPPGRGHSGAIRAGMTMRPQAVSAALLLVSAAFLATFAAVAAPTVLLFGLLSQLTFLLAGVLIVRAVAPGGGWLAPLAFGPLLGQALGSAVLTLLWVAGGRGPWLMVAAPVVVAVLAWPARRLAGRWRLPFTEPSDALALLMLLLLVPLVVGLPFAHVGEISADGQDYRAYFTADYVWRRAVVVELAKGDVLPINPYFKGDALHYYWMPHVLSAVQYRLVDTWATLDELLLIRSVSIDAVLIAFLYGMGRTFGVRAVGRGRRRGVRGPGVELRRALCALRFRAEQRAPGGGEESQHRRGLALVFPGHPDRRPAAAAVLPAAPRGRLWDRHDWPDRDREAHPAGGRPGVRDCGPVPRAVGRDQLVCGLDADRRRRHL